MSSDQISKPHGGSLVQITVDEDRAAKLKALVMNLPDVILNDRQLCDLELIATGAFSPLQGFMTKAEYESVVDKGILPNGLCWPIPVYIDVSEDIAKNISINQPVALRDMEGFLLAIMTVSDIWQPDKLKEAKQVYGTDSRLHPAVEELLESARTYSLGGKIIGLQQPVHYDHLQVHRAKRSL